MAGRSTNPPGAKEDASVVRRRGPLTVRWPEPSSSTTGAETRPLLYQAFLKGVKSPREADTGNLALKVLVTQTGGRILGPDNDVVGQIVDCISDANSFYRISFDPPHAEHADEYHDLRVSVAKPGFTVRTNTGYYNQPAEKQD